LIINTEEAEAYIEDEDDRGPASRGPTNARKRPLDTGAMSEADMASLKRKLPFLADFSDNFIRSQTTGDLLKMESTAIKLKMLERSTDHDDRLASNRMSLEDNGVILSRGEDNRWTKLHPARFLPGMACSTKKMWTEAREQLGLTGGKPVGCYDMGSVGMGGFVTNKGWIELANPSSSKISLRMFTINNCGSKLMGGKSDATKDQELNDIVELGEFKVALRAMRVAASFVAPWNFSFVAIENFLVQSNFCAADLGNLDKQAQILTQFVDYVLGENSNKWRDSEPFLDTTALKGHWESFFAARPQSGLAAKAKQSSQQAQKKPPTTQRRPWIDICFDWNNGRCLKAPGQCKSLRGTDLRHVCSWVLDRSKTPPVYCEKNHPRLGNH